jgi:ribonuclease P protein component
MPVPKKPFGLPAAYRIKRQTVFDKLTQQGDSIYVYPFKLIFTETGLPEDVPYQVAFGVSKKKFKKAVRRNRIKRLMRETFRLKQHLIPQDKSLALLVIYTSKKEEKFDFLLEQMESLLNKLTGKLNNDGTT